MKTQSNCTWLTQSGTKWVRACHDLFRFYLGSSWMKKWREFFNQSLSVVYAKPTLKNKKSYKRWKCQLQQGFYKGTITKITPRHPFFNFFIKRGRLAMIVPVNDVHCNSSVTNNEKSKDFLTNNTLSLSPMYNALYKVWEGMANDNIITEVIWSNHLSFFHHRMKLKKWRSRNISERGRKLQSHLYQTNLQSVKLAWHLSRCK